MFLTDMIVADRTTTLPCPVIAHDMPLAAAIDLFRERPGLRVLPVVDRHYRPVGVVPEIAVRRILFNPYGHALMQNPSFGGRLTNLMVPCPVAEIGWPAARQLESHAAIGGEALILTSGGRFHSMLDAPALLALAARVEAAATGDRIARAERIDAAVAAFASGAEELASNLHEAAGAIVAMSNALAERARETLGNASAVAAASMQTSDALSDIAARENDLVDALARIDRDMRDARRIRADTTTRLAAAVGRVATLANSATSIDSMSTLIQEVAARTNLISLNASIEAARAGEAGRGFAVVATEVKALAGQTKGTAQAITGQVERIGDLIGGVIADQDRIGQDVALIDRLSSSIDDAVERQTTATATVSAALGQSAMASRAIGEDARRIGADADQLRQDVDGLLQLSASLTTIAGQMTAKTTAFIEAIDV